MGCRVGPQIQELLQEAVLDPGLGESGRLANIHRLWEIVEVSLILPDNSE